MKEKFNTESNDQIAFDLNKEMVNGIKQFGEYSFEDKGPDEVMNISKFDRIMKNKNIEDVADILNKFYDLAKDKGHALSVINNIILGLDDRDDFEDLWNYDINGIFEY